MRPVRIPVKGTLSLSVPLLALLCLAQALAQEKPQAPAPSPSPRSVDLGQSVTFPAQIEQVTVDVVVTDKKGKPVTTLSQSDFKVFDEGKPQELISFEKVVLPEKPTEAPPPMPKVAVNTAEDVRAVRTFAIVFDDIHLAPFQAHRAKGAVAEFLKNGVREGDRVTLVATGGGAWWSTRMEVGRGELMTLLKRLDGRNIPDMSPERMSDYEAMRIHVYHDTQVAERVARRFETYGVTQRMQRDSAGAGGLGIDQDPLVAGRASDVYFQALSRNRITLEAVERVLNSLVGTKGRKSMILVSEGFIYDPNMDEFKRIQIAARRANVAIYFLDTRGLGGMSVYATAQFGPPIAEQDIGAGFMEHLEASEGAESMAAESGGFSVKNTNDLGKGIQRIADETRSYYLIGYNPNNLVRDGRFHKIEVKVAGKGLELRARKGYYAPFPDGTRSVLDAKKKGGDPVIQAALDSPFEEPAIPMRMTSHIFDETLLGKANVLLSADVDVGSFVFQEQEGRFVDTLEMLMVVAHRETNEVFRYDQKVDMKLLPATRERLRSQWFPLNRDFELAPGGYQAKLVVRDKNSARVGSIIHFFEVPELTQFRTSSVVITDTLQPQRDAGEKAPPRPAVVARRVFKPGGVLYAQFEVFGADKDKKTGMPRVSAGYVIQTKDGKVITGVAPSVIQPTSLGKLSRMVGSRIDEVAPGEYEWILNLRDEVSGKVLQVREPFTVVG